MENTKDGEPVKSKPNVAQESWAQWFRLDRFFRSPLPSATDYAVELAKELAPTKEEIRGYIKVSAMLYFSNTLIIKPTIGFGERLLNYIETDDPETAAERIAFDNLQHELRIADIALQKAKEQGVNRRGLATSFWGEGRAAGLCPREHSILLESMCGAKQAPKL